MLQNCYEYFGRCGTSAGEVHQQTRYIDRRGNASLSSLCARVRAWVHRACSLSIYARDELEAGSWMDELVNYKLWIEVMGENGRTWKQEFTTAREMRDTIKKLDRNYIVCDEHYGAHDDIGESWITHYGKVLD